MLLKKKNRFFGQALQYDLLDNVQNQQWGNVASLAKAAPVSAVSRGYTYTYDPINRLKGAVYAGAAGEDFSLSGVDYDPNGNLSTMQRAASTPALGASSAEDNLSYTYAANSNRLLRVSDAGVATSSGKKAHYFNDRNTGSDDYAYDAAGNLTQDLNREITHIGYNVLGLPEEIRFANNDKIFYLYTASGAKLQKQGAYLPGATPGSTVRKKIDYLAAGVFAEEALAFIPTAEGRALPPNTALGGTAFRYEYQLTDNLDNLRTACRCGEKLDSLGNVVALLPGDDLRNLVQENAYDPWGLNLPDLERSAVLPDWWQFSTKERDYRAYDEFEFRHYDAAIGRFMSIDPLFQQFRGISPFNYADNNPSTFIDLYGLQGVNPAWLVNLTQEVVVKGQHYAPAFKSLVGGIATGVGMALARNYEALKNPQQMVEGLAQLSTMSGQIQATVGMNMLYDQTRVAWNSGDPYARGEIIGNIGTEVLLSLAVSRGTGALYKAGRASRVVTAEMRLAGFGGRAAEGVVNSKGLMYPKVIVEGFGEVPFPRGPFLPNNTATRAIEFTGAFKKSFKAWWIEQGRPYPTGEIQIHHIKPLAHGGTNTFENLVPLTREQHMPFTKWWLSYPKQ